MTANASTWMFTVVDVEVHEGSGGQAGTRLPRSGTSRAARPTWARGDPSQYTRWSSLSPPATGVATYAAALFVGFGRVGSIHSNSNRVPAPPHSKGPVVRTSWELCTSDAN